MTALGKQMYRNQSSFKAAAAELRMQAPTTIKTHNQRL